MLWTHMFALADDVFVLTDSCHRGSRRCNVALCLIMCGYCVWLKTKQLMSPLKLIRRRQIRQKGKFKIGHQVDGAKGVIDLHLCITTARTKQIL